MGTMDNSGDIYFLTLKFEKICLMLCPLRLPVMAPGQSKLQQDVFRLKILESIKILNQTGDR